MGQGDNACRLDKSQVSRKKIVSVARIVGKAVVGMKKPGR
jgi:hypothetical protein